MSGATTTIEEYLPKHPFFTGLDDDAIALVTGCAVNVHFRPGQYLFREGRPADAFYVVRHGRVAIQTRLPTREAVLDSARDSDVVGWSWLVPPYRWTFDAMATEDTSVVKIDGVCLRDKCAADSGLGYAFLQRVVQVMSVQLHSAQVRLLDLYGTQP